MSVFDYLPFQVDQGLLPLGAVAKVGRIDHRLFSLYYSQLYGLRRRADRPKAMCALSIFLLVQKFYPAVIINSAFYFLLGPFGALVRVFTGQPTAWGYIMVNIVFWGACTIAAALLVYSWETKSENEKIKHALLYAFVFLTFAAVVGIL